MPTGKACQLAIGIFEERIVRSIIWMVDDLFRLRIEELSAAKVLSHLLPGKLYRTGSKHLKNQMINQNSSQYRFLSIWHILKRNGMRSKLLAR